MLLSRGCGKVFRIKSKRARNFVDYNCSIVNTLIAWWENPLNNSYYFNMYNFLIVAIINREFK